MASFMYAVMSITHVASMHCAERPEISPCTCEPIYAHNYVELSCEKVDSFHTIVAALSDRFEMNVNISLKISYSQLEDLEMRTFKDMKLNVVKLRMQWNGLKSLPELPFRGLSNVEFLSVGDNELDEVPKHVLTHMPIVKTLDLGRCRIQSLLQDDFKGTQMVTNLFLPSNNITRVDKSTFPPGLVTLHLGRNQIESLNGSLRHLNKLESLFINMNLIGTLDDELPESNMLKLIIAQNNRLKYLPKSMRYFHRLETLQMQNNRLEYLDGILKHARILNQFIAHNNSISYLNTDDFLECISLTDLDLSNNFIKALNHSLLHLPHLSSANFSSNEIEEFSMHEIRGLMFLQELDLSHNRIQKLTGHQENTVEQDSLIINFNLDYNQLKSLDLALTGLNNLRILSLSHNRIESILPKDFMGLIKLEILDLSHNQLLTLKEMQTTMLPSLKILKVAYNNITKLEKDFHGLPVLCQANLKNNQISSISPELVQQTRCMNHNVPGKLELHLEDNPIMCEERLNELCTEMLRQETRIRGRSKCFDNDQEVCTVLPMLFTKISVPANLPLLLQQQAAVVPANTNTLMRLFLSPEVLINNPNHELPQIKAPRGQHLVKAPLGTEHISRLTKSEQFVTTTNTTPQPTTTTTISALSNIITTTSVKPKTVLRSTEDQPVVLSIDEPATFTSNNSELKILDNASAADTVTVAQTEYATLNEDELLKSQQHFSALPEIKHVNTSELINKKHVELEDSKLNLVHDEYTPVILPNEMENAPHRLIIPEEPPEKP